MTIPPDKRIGRRPPVMTPGRPAAATQHALTTTRPALEIER